MNTFRTKILTYGGKKGETLLYSFIVAFTVVLRMQTEAFCVFKKKKKQKGKKSQKNQKKTLQEMAVKITPMHKDPTPPRYRSLEPVFPYQAWGLISFFLFFFFSSCAQF